MLMFCLQYTMWLHYSAVSQHTLKGIAVHAAKYHHLHICWSVACITLLMKLHTLSIHKLSSPHTNASFGSKFQCCTSGAASVVLRASPGAGAGVDLGFHPDSHLAAA